MQKRVPLDHSTVKDFAIPIGKNRNKDRQPLQPIDLRQSTKNANTIIVPTIDLTANTSKIPRVQNKATTSKVIKKRKPKNNAPNSKLLTKGSPKKSNLVQII